MIINTITSLNNNPVYNHIKPARCLTTFSTRLRRYNKCSFTPSGISLTPQHDIIITDLGRDCVEVYSTEGKLKLTLKTLPYLEPTQAVYIESSRRTKKTKSVFNATESYAGYIAVVCLNDIRLYSPKTGEFVRKLNTDDMDSPRAITTTNDKKKLVVADVRQNGAIINTYSVSRNVETNNSDIIIGGKRAPCFTQPRYLCTDSKHNIYVSDYCDHMIKMFTSNGILIEEFGKYGAKVGELSHQSGICTDIYDNLIVADTFNNRIQLFFKNSRDSTILLKTDDDESPIDVVTLENGTLVVLHANGKVASYEYLCYL